MLLRKLVGLAPGLALAGLLVGCASPLAVIGGDRTLEQRVMAYYADHAMEVNATCPNPQIDTISTAKPGPSSGQATQVDLRYHWTDDTQSTDLGNGGTYNGCTGWGERTFMLQPGSGGELEVSGMSGPQKR